MLPAPSAVATGQVEERVSYERFNKQTVAQLKELCNEWGLPRGGNKGVLVSRLLTAGGPPAELPKAALRSQMPATAGPWMQKCVNT